METKWTSMEHSTGVLEVTVEGENWKKAQKKTFKRFKSQIDLKGFRKGHVPDAIVRKQIPAEVIYDYAAEEVANEALSYGVEQEKIELVDRPSLEVKDASEEKATLVFNCTVMPEVTLKEYKGLDIHKNEVEVTEEDVENEVKRIQERFADWTLREDEEEAQNGDQVKIDYLGTIDGVPFDGGSAEDYPLELGSGTFIPGFEEQLVGCKAGDEKDVNVTFPEEYHDDSVAGKEAVFKCKVHEVRYKELPEADDELIKRLNQEGVETLEQYKEKTKADLQKSREQQAEDQFTQELLDKVVEDAEVEIPDVMIRNEIDRNYRNFLNQMSRAGFTEKQYFEATHQTPEQVKELLKPEAEYNVKSTLVIDAIAKQENIEISDEEAEAEYKEMSERYQMDVEQIKKMVSVDNVKYDLAHQKAIELLKSSVK